MGSRSDSAIDAKHEAEEAFNHCSNWGRWGYDDELGTPNFITQDKRCNAAKLVRSGRVYALGKNIILQGERTRQMGVMHRMTIADSPIPSAQDIVALGVHGDQITHVDALGHCFLGGMAYNGRTKELIHKSTGLQACSISALGEGVFTRGVLLDVAKTIEARQAIQSEQENESNHPAARNDVVTGPDLEQSQLYSGVHVTTGDAVIVYSGFNRTTNATNPGLDISAVKWLKDHEVSAYGGDCIEHMPSGVPGLPMPLHQLGLVAMGLCIIDAIDTAMLNIACKKEQRNEFLFIVAPIRLSGGTGSPVNPLAVF